MGSVTHNLFKLFRGGAGQSETSPHSLAARMTRRSSGLNEFSKAISGQERLCILDLGCTSATNISHLTGMGHKLCTEDLLEAARREFEEELGFKPDGACIPLSSIKQKSGKIVHAWAFAGDCDPGRIQSNTFTMEWPPHSGKKQEFPEVDRAAFFGIEEAKRKINPAQVALLEELSRALAKHHPY